MPKPPTKKDILDGAADEIWDFIAEEVGAGRQSTSGKYKISRDTPLAARRCAHDLIAAYEEAHNGYDITSVLGDLDVAGTGYDVGRQLARRAVSPLADRDDARRRYGIVTLHVKLQDEDLVWTISTCDATGLEHERIPPAEPTTSLARRNPSSFDRYEVVDRDTMRVVGHVEASWIGDAQDQAEQRFGKNVQVFVETKGQPNRVGELGWAGRARQNPPCGCDDAVPNPPRKTKRGAPPKGAVFQITLMRSRGHGRGVGDTYTSLEEAQKNAEAMRDREVRAGKFNREHWYEVTAYEPGATPDEVGAALDGPWALLGSSFGGKHWTYSPSDAEYRAAGFTRY